MSTDPYPPLITPRSPSYENARRELEHPAPIGDAAVVASLSKLYEAEENARDALTAAARAVSDPELASRLRETAQVHADRRDALGELVRAKGGLPPRADEVRELLDHGAAAVRGWVLDKDAMGVNDAVLAELVYMRRELEALYAEAIDDPDLDDKQRDALRHLAPQ